MISEKRRTSDAPRWERGWGHERWLHNDELYCAKMLIVEPGKRGSLHFHKVKTETMLCLAGHGTINAIVPDDGRLYSFSFSIGEFFTIPPCHPHQIVNDDHSDQLVIVEFSTKHEETDTYRIQKGD